MVAVVVAAACSQVPGFWVLNLSGETVRVITVTHEGERREKVLADGGARRFYHYKWESSRQLMAGPCTYTYEPSVSLIPAATLSSEAMADRFHGTGLQIASDFGLYVRPRNRVPMTEAELAPFQPPGFPLRPVSRVCGEGAGQAGA